MNAYYTVYTYDMLIRTLNVSVEWIPLLKYFEHFINT